MGIITRVFTDKRNEMAMITSKHDDHTKDGRVATCFLSYYAGVSILVRTLIMMSMLLLLVSCGDAASSGGKLSKVNTCKDGARLTVDEIQMIGGKKYKTKSPLLVPTQDAMCNRGYSNQIECFARFLLLARAMDAVLVLEKVRFWSAPYQHKDDARLEPLSRPDPPFPHGQAPPPAMTFNDWWDEDFFIQELYCQTGIPVLKHVPTTARLPPSRCMQVRDITGKTSRATKGSVVLNCWQKANFIGERALLLKKAVLASLRPGALVRHFSSQVINGLQELDPTGYRGIHLRLEADAAAGGISRKIDPDQILAFLLKHKLNNNSVLYVASGGFKGKEEVLADWGKRFILRTKESFVPLINEMLPERELRAAVEFDVLRSSNVLFGHGCSSMTTINTQIRCFSPGNNATAAYYYDEHFTKGTKPYCKEQIWNGNMAIRLNDKSSKPYNWISNLYGSGLRKVPCLPRSKI